MAFNRKQFWRDDTDSGLPVMVVPYLKEINNFSYQTKVNAQVHRCAEQLAAHLFKWKKEWPSLSRVMFWSVSEKRFLGLDLDNFAIFIERQFRVQTEDRMAWRLDRVIAARIWATCIADDSPLPPASWQIELNRKREGKL
jgi:hypothetical protein